MSEPPVGFGIIGAGHMGNRHATAIAAAPGARLAAVWSRTAQHAAQLAAQSGASACPSIDALAERPDVDAVLVCTPPTHHAEAALAAIAAGKHVIVEKPLARTLQDAQRIVDAASRAGVVLLCGHVVRFYQQFRALHDRVAAGAAGTPAVLHMSRETATLLQGWRADAAESGGVVLDLGIHEFDWLLWTLGPVHHVFCRAVTREPGQACSYALTTLRMESGAIAEVESSALLAGGFRTAGEIAGDGGILTYDSTHDQALRLDSDPPGRAEWQGLPTSYTEVSPYVAQMQHWVRCIRGNEQPQVTPEDMLSALKVALAAIESAETGKVVTP